MINFQRYNVFVLVDRIVRDMENHVYIHNLIQPVPILQLI